jgi:hypothetical protein
MPRLAYHTCHNGKGKSFREECKSTEIPHLFEHVIIELQLMAQQNPDDHLCGETEWNWQVDPYGRFRVTVDYHDEMLAFASIRLAERVLASLDRRDLSIDLPMEVERLRKLYLLGQELNSAPSSNWVSATTRSWTSSIPPYSTPPHTEPSRPTLPSLLGDRTVMSPA